MKSLEELLLLWQDGALAQSELEELNRQLREPAGRSVLAREFALTAGLCETAQFERAHRVARRHADAFGTLELRRASAGTGSAHPVRGLWHQLARLWPASIGPRWKLGLALAAFALAWIPVANLLARRDHIARLEAPSAGVRLQRGTQTLTPEQAGYWVQRGDQLTVPTDAVTSLVYPEEKTRLQLQGGSIVTVLEGEVGKRLELNRGTLSAEVAPQAEGQAMLVVTPHAVATVLGTEFSLSVTPDRSRLEVLSGTIRLARREDEKSILVAAGNYATAGQGTELAARPLLQAPWQSQDIGLSTRPGSARFESDGKKCHVNTHASEHRHGRDDFHFVYQTMDGDGEICARVLRFDSRDRRTKAGVVIRESLKSDAVTAFLRVNAGRGLEFKRRGGSETRTEVVGQESFPYWVRLVRRGSDIIAYKSPDGQVWTRTGTGRFDLGGRIYIGLGVTSADNTSGAAVFDNVTILSTPREL
jgi:hypothetical protein